MIEVSFISAVGEFFTQLGKGLEIFTKEPMVYFTAASFGGVVLGSVKRVLPMKRK